MQCEGMFKFRGLTHVDAGSFTPKGGGVVEYKESYKLKTAIALQCKQQQ